MKEHIFTHKVTFKINLDEAGEAFLPELKQRLANSLAAAADKGVIEAFAAGDDTSWGKPEPRPTPIAGLGLWKTEVEAGE